MTILPDYRQFDGLHWDTSTIRNVLDYQGVVAPHTGKPFTEAMLFGISGGVIAGYFPFEYKGHEPWFNFLTRNTLDPMGRLIERLGLPTQVKQTTKSVTAIKNLTDALEAGSPALVWADIYRLPYIVSPANDDFGLNLPIVVYGYENDTAYIADRAHVPLMVSADALADARGRSASNKYRLMTLGTPDIGRLISAVEFGILACAAYMLDDPPLKPMKGKFGLDAFTRWADLLASSKKDGWAKVYPGAKLYSVLHSGYRYMNLSGTERDGGRAHYADFLDEAAVILGQPALNRVAEAYHESAKNWRELNHALLPDSIPAFHETRTLLDRQADLFLTTGGESLPERQKIAQRLSTIQAEMKVDFPLTDTEVSVLRENLRHHVVTVQSAERTAASALRRAMG